MMAENVKFERLFDGWENDTELAMVDLEKDTSPPTSPKGPDDSDETLISRHKTNNSASPLPSPRPTLTDNASTRFLLRKASSIATASDYEAVKSLNDDFEGETRQRNGFGSGVRRLLPTRRMLSQRSYSTFDGQFAHGRPGLWRKQMLVDRSLRSMAAFTAVCAAIMSIIVFSYLKDFVDRINKNTTSVGGRAGESCKTAESRNIAVHLFINIAATMILGCSNTYQQLITSLKVDEVRWVLSKRGDSKVGTNSPFSINHKRDGKLKAWLAWLLLIGTSLPVHFLANSVIGPSFLIQMPTKVTYSQMDHPINYGYTYNSGINYIYESPSDSACWVAFRTGSYILPKEASQISNNYNPGRLGNATTFANVDVSFTSNCTQYNGTGTYEGALSEVLTNNVDLDPASWTYGIDNCTNGINLYCTLSNPQGQECRMNVRMQAAFILMGCLIIKAAYMIVQNFRARFQTKEHLLTFGDVIVASVLDPDLKVKNECLLNSGDGWRSQVAHTCHKHCKDPVPSKTGDSIGHCQKCKKFNDVNKSADLPHPSIAIKYKRSLLSNLGSNAISQMIVLVFSSAAMLAFSIMLIVNMVVASQAFNDGCHGPRPSQTLPCSQGVGSYLRMQYGSWGGFTSSATLGSFTADSLGAEFVAFAVSNGAQFLYSLLYLLLIYNITLISMEQEWGKWETTRKRPRCTIVRGKPFDQSYFLQLPSRILIPIMVYAALMHWLLGQAISTTETIYTDPKHGVQHSIYFITYAAYPIFISTVLMIAMTVVCWWAFTFTREGFIPQMYGSIRALCASTTELTDFNADGIQWGDLGKGDKFRHAGFSSDEPGQIIPAELYCGKD